MYKSMCILALAVAASAQEKLTLRDALESTAKLSPSVQSAKLDILKREAATMQVRSGYGPQLNLAIGGSYQQTNLQGIGLAFPGFSNRIGPYRTFNARPVLTQTVLDLSLLSEIKAARERTRESQDSAEAVREATQFAVLQLYLQVLEAESRLTSAQARLRSAQAVRNQTADREQGGTASKLDLQRAEGELADEHVRAEAAKRDRDVLKTLLARTIGMDRSVGELEPLPVKDKPLVEEELVAQAYRERHELNAVEHRLAADSLSIESARRQRWPKLGFSGDWGVLGPGPNEAIGTYAVGATLTIPLWTSGRIESEIAAAAIRRRKTEATQHDLRLEIVQQIRQSIVEINSSRDALRFAERSTSAARETLELSTLRASGGLATSLDVVIAQGRLAEAEDQEIRSRYQLQLAEARLARARGNVWSFLD